MRKILTTVILFLSILNTSAYTNSEKLAADFLSYKDVINIQENPDNYELDKKITRREMSKVTLKLSERNTYNTCNGTFSDLKDGDWGCKYAESGLKYKFFAKNSNFKPDSNISKIEALKMIIKARNIKKAETEDWREGYVIAGINTGLLEEKFTDYDTKANRSWIFKIGQHAIEYSGKDEDINIIEKLLNL